MTTQTIYFDADEHDFDGNGWNIVDDGSVALRFPTFALCTQWCRDNKLPYTLHLAPRTFVAVEYVKRTSAGDRIFAHDVLAHDCGWYYLVGDVLCDDDWAEPVTINIEAITNLTIL